MHLAVQERLTEQFAVQLFSVNPDSVKLRSMCVDTGLDMDAVTTRYWNDISPYKSELDVIVLGRTIMLFRRDNSHIVAKMRVTFTAKNQISALTTQLVSINELEDLRGKLSVSGTEEV